jgi:hypothetical protein
MSQGMMYAIAIEGTASPAAEFDAFEYTAPADAVAIIHAVRLGQNSDYGDAAAEGLMARIITGHATSGSGGSAATPRPLQLGFAAAGGSAEVMNTTIASTGTPITKHAEPFNAQIGMEYRPTPEERIVVSPSERVVIRVSAPADALTMVGEVIIEEKGG